jgi:hypothetical protein
MTKMAAIAIAPTINLFLVLSESEKDARGAVATGLVC